MRHAIILKGLVDNLVAWDGETEWIPPDGASVVALADDVVCGIGWTYDGTTFTAPPPPAAPAFDKALPVKLAAIATEYQRRVAAGWPYPYQDASVVIDIDADGRANLNGLALDAFLAISGVGTWDLGQGWVARGGTRIPFANPQDAIPFAKGAAAYYSSLVQHEQDLADAAKACATASDPASALAAVAQTAGWPG